MAREPLELFQKREEKITRDPKDGKSRMVEPQENQNWQLGLSLLISGLQGSCARGNICILLLSEASLQTSSDSLHKGIIQLCVRIYQELTAPSVSVDPKNLLGSAQLLGGSHRSGVF